ncbi:uncharacterized protein [Miscanthus floridulus]|uniref:uncharacterized protein n=1 Tax=Miscanthus floridulus TaxID=154761 RepID=UPI0034590CCD
MGRPNPTPSSLVPHPPPHRRAADPAVVPLQRGPAGPAPTPPSRAPRPRPGRRSRPAPALPRPRPDGPAPAPRVPGRRPELAGAPGSELPGDSDPAGPELPHRPRAPPVPPCPAVGQQREKERSKRKKEKREEEEEEGADPTAHRSSRRSDRPLILTLLQSSPPSSPALALAVLAAKVMASSRPRCETASLYGRPRPPI